MNDKDFIEELKRKRDEYGVTQTRLAVACGISREHYNRIVQWFSCQDTNLIFL